MLSHGLLGVSWGLSGSHRGLLRGAEWLQLALVQAATRVIGQRLGHKIDSLFKDP